MRVGPVAGVRAGELRVAWLQTSMGTGATGTGATRIRPRELRAARAAQAAHATLDASLFKSPVLGGGHRPPAWARSRCGRLWGHMKPVASACCACCACFAR